MRNLSPILFAGMLLTACVDKDYDITNVDTDNITIGTDGDEENAASQFRIPLATVRVTMDDIASGDVNVKEIFAEADVWLPTDLDGGYADIGRLKSDPDYLDAILSGLNEEMMRADEKMRAVTDLIRGKYLERFLHLIPGITGDETDEQFYEAFRTVFRHEPALRDRLSYEVGALARSYLTDLHVEALTYDAGHIDLSGDIVDMLSRNLDPRETAPAKNTLHLYGEIVSKLPLTMFIEAKFNPTAVRCPIRVDAQQPTNPIEETRLYEEDLRQIVDGMQIVIPVTFEKYYPGIGFDDTADDQIIIRLRLVKRGGLTL